MKLFPCVAAASLASLASLDEATGAEAVATIEAVVPLDEVITGEDGTLGNWTTLSVVVLPVEVASEDVCTNKSASITISNLFLSFTLNHFIVAQ